MKPIESMLGKQGSEVMCTPWIHWFVVGAKVGDKCVCGKTTKEGKKRKPKPHTIKNGQA